MALVEAFNRGANPFAEDNDFTRFSEVDKSEGVWRNTALAGNLANDIDPKTGKPRNKGGIDAGTQALIDDIQQDFNERMQDLLNEIAAVSEQLQATRDVVKKAKNGTLDRNNPADLALIAAAGLDANDRNADLIATGTEQDNALTNRLGDLTDDVNRAIMTAEAQGIDTSIAANPENQRIISEADALIADSDRNEQERLEVATAEPTQTLAQATGFLTGSSPLSG